MTQLPFLIPECTLGLRISRMMIIINMLALNKKKNPTLSIEKLILYDFLIRYPIVLINILRNSGKQVNFILRDTEFGTLETNNIDTFDIYEYEEARKLIQVMISMGLIKVEIVKGEILISATEMGDNFINSLESEYLVRLKDLVHELKKLQSEKEAQLREKITLYVRGV